jgi:hypothetical protein
MQGNGRAVAKSSAPMVKQHSRRLPLLTALGVAAFATVCSSPASAAVPQASFAVTPVVYDPALPVTKSYFVFPGRRGEVIKGQVRIANTGTATGTAFLYVVDATTGKTSGAVHRSHQSPRRDVGAWTRLARSRVTLGPQASVVVPFRVEVPAGARPGDHLGGIVAENASVPRSAGRGALRIRIRHLTIAAVLVQLPGAAVARIAIDGVRAGDGHGYQYVYLHLANAGALATKPRGRLLVSDRRGHRIARREFQLDTFLPGTAIDYPVLLPRRALRPGAYRASVALSYGASALGYRREEGPWQRLSRTFGFSVKSGEYATVFRGAAPLAAQRSEPGTSWGGGLLVVGLVGILAGLLLAVVLRLGIRRLAHR